MAGTLTLKGLDATVTGLQAAQEKIVQATAAALYQEGLAIMAISQQEVPVDTGTLRSSGQVQQPEIQTGAVMVTLGYGYGEKINPKTGESAQGYSIPVHERLGVHHPHGKAKYLEDPARAAEAGFEARVGEKVAAEVVR